MTLHDLLENTLSDTLQTSLVAFRPELTLCATIVLLLLVKMLAPHGKISAYHVMLIGTAAALCLALRPDGLVKPSEIFTGMLVHDTFSIYLRRMLLTFALLFAVFTQLTGVPEREDSTEFFVLTLGAVLGMCLMVSANHMLIVFLAVEMASVPSYVLAGFLKHRRRSAEAALKYAVFGAGTAGVMLYGISLLVGTLGSAHLPTMAVQLADMLQQTAGTERTLVLALGGLMLMVGLAFKLSAVPFHFWAPDVFEGASAEVAAFLSIASKAAALGLLVRLALGFSYIGGFSYTDTYSATASPHQEVPVRLVSLDEDETADDRAASEPGGPSSVSDTNAPVSVSLVGESRAEALRPVRQYIGALVGLLAALTCTFGNLAAYGQTNIKRLLAYSTIAHAGYMMMPVAAAVALIDGGNLEGARAAVGSLAFYIWIYVFMNLGAFAGVAFLRNATGSEEIADYAGLIRRSPGLAICMAIVMFSLVGLPPLAGFAAKFTIFAGLFHAGLLVLLAIGGLNTVLSLFYYLRVVKVMVLAPEPKERQAATIPMSSAAGLFCLAMAVMLVGLGVWWGWLYEQAQLAVSTLLL